MSFAGIVNGIKNILFLFGIGSGEEHEALQKKEL